MRARALGLHRWRARLACLAAFALALPLATGCGKPIDLKTALQVTNVSSGWFDDGIVDGKNKLVPSITFTLKNASAEPLSLVQLNLQFRRVGETDDWDTAFLKGVGSDALAPGAETAPITVRAKLGYTSEEPRAEMFQHKLWVDATVRIFAKHGSEQWTNLGDFPVKRILLTAH